MPPTTLVTRALVSIKASKPVGAGRLEAGMGRTQVGQMLTTILRHAPKLCLIVQVVRPGGAIGQMDVELIGGLWIFHCGHEQDKASKK